MDRALTYDLVSLCHTVTFASNICFTPLVLKYVLCICGPRNKIYYQIKGQFLCFNFKVEQLKSERKGKNNVFIKIL